MKNKYQWYFQGIVEPSGNTTQARSSYLPEEILWGHRSGPDDKNLECRVAEVFFSAFPFEDLMIDIPHYTNNAKSPKEKEKGAKFWRYWWNYWYLQKLTKIGYYFCEKIHCSAVVSKKYTKKLLWRSFEKNMSWSKVLLLQCDKLKFISDFVHVCVMIGGGGNTLWICPGWPS